MLPSVNFDGTGLAVEGEELSGCLAESWVFGFTINLRIELSDAEGEVLMGAMGIDEMEKICSGE